MVNKMKENNNNNKSLLYNRPTYILNNKTKTESMSFSSV